MFQTFSNFFSPAAYLNPWSALAGVLLILAPIIIHLINRMRFKRVRWAAMEFLLKAQRRMKRKLIVEQLLLLVLRCLLMLLLGLLIARFFGFDMSGQDTKTTAHYVILDDSPSMADPIGEDGGEAVESFERAKRVLTEQIATAASAATTPQSMEVIRTSEPENPLPIERLNNSSIDELRANLLQYRTSTVRPNMAALIRKAGDKLNEKGPETGKVLHLLSDFRSIDWAEQGEAIKETVKALNEGGVKVHFVDIASPDRKVDKKIPNFHDNVGIVELRPAKAVVAQKEPVEFTLKLKNFGTAELKDVRVSIRVNGDEAKGGRSVSFGTIPPGQTVSEKFELIFDRVGEGENPFAGRTAGVAFNEGEKADIIKAFQRFNLVTAVIVTKEEGGIEADNIRHAGVEVRQALPILVVDGVPDKRETKEGDSLYLEKFIESSGTSFQWNYGTVQDLANTDLSKYSFILMLNVPALTEAARKNLEAYVANGGGCGFWLGGAVKADEYNNQLYRGGEGLFPVPLPKDPFPPKSPDQMDPKELEEYENTFRDLQFSPQKKFLVKDPVLRGHPALSGFYSDGKGVIRNPEQIEIYYKFVKFKRYWPVERIGRWTEDKTVTELMCLANHQKMDSYERDADALIRSLPVNDIDFSKYKEALSKVQRNVATLLRETDASTSKLSDVFDRLLSDQRNEGDAEEALLREFWGDARNKDLKAKVARMRDKMKYGYPLYFAKTFGRGRVTVITTTSGEAWNDWASEKPGSVSFIFILRELTTYLAGGGVDDNRACGNPIEFKLDPEGYDLKTIRGFLTHKTKSGENAAGPGATDAPLVLDGQITPLTVETYSEKVMVKEGETMVEKSVERKAIAASRTDTSIPGLYLFAFEQRRAKSGNPNDVVSAAEYRFAPVNIDVNAEGDLRRASTEDVLSQAPGASLHSPDDKEWFDKLKNKKSDLSELGWMFAILLVVLVAEQGLAAKLSYAASQDTLEDQAPSAAAALRRNTELPAASDPSVA